MTREDILATLRALGITQKQLRRAQWLASLSTDDFETAKQALRSDKFDDVRRDLEQRVMRRALRKRAPTAT